MKATRFRELFDVVLMENRTVLERIRDDEVQLLVEEIGRANSIQLFGMGRMQISVRGLAMRLMHMGFAAHVVYDTTTPRISRGDLLIINCGVTAVSLNIIKLARDAGATVCVITAHPENEHGRLAHFTVTVPGQFFGSGQEVSSIQPMASLLEQSLLLFEDIVVMLLMERYQITPESMAERHTNLEGIDTEFA